MHLTKFKRSFHTPPLPPPSRRRRGISYYRLLIYIRGLSTRWLRRRITVTSCVSNVGPVNNRRSCFCVTNVTMVFIWNVSDQLLFEFRLVRGFAPSVLMWRSRNSKVRDWNCVFVLVFVFVFVFQVWLWLLMWHCFCHCFNVLQSFLRRKFLISSGFVGILFSGTIVLLLRVIYC